MFRGDVQDGIRGKTRHGLGRSFVRASRRNQTGDWSTVSSIRQEHVPDSWAVVRDVCDRLVSEFAWARLQGWYQRHLGANKHAVSDVFAELRTRLLEVCRGKCQFSDRCFVEPLESGALGFWRFVIGGTCQWFLDASPFPVSIESKQ